MSLDISHSTKNAKQYGKRYGNTDMWESALEDSIPYYHVSGSSEPYLPVILSEEPEQVDFLQWGFIPLEFAPHIKGKPVKTFNARDHRIFTEQSIFKESAESKRCLIMIDGFFEHYMKDGIAYPHYVQMKTKEPFMVAGIWQTFTDPTDEVKTSTVAIVTSPANKEVAWLHSEKPYTPESRMMFIVDKKDDETWLHGSTEEVQALMKPLPDGLLEYYPCQPLKTVKKLYRTYLGNVPSIHDKKHYKKLD